MNKFIIAIMCVVGVATAYAENENAATSQAYVDAAAAGLQDNLPAKTSDKVVTYTATAGTPGEREIKTELGNESTNQADTGLTTTGTVKTAVDNKQEKIMSLPATNVVTYSGTNGTPTITQIYDDTVNTFDNGLVTAKTLNDAVIAAVEAEATKIQTSKGALWRFNRTPPKVLPTTANLLANVEGRGEWCHHTIQTPSDGTDEHVQGSCSNTLFNSLYRGDWGVVFPYNTGITYDNDTCVGTNCYKEIHGISACTNQAGAAEVWTIDPESIWSSLDTAYNNGKNGQPDGQYCHCKVVGPAVPGLHWIYLGRFKDTGTCATHCAIYCAWRNKTLVQARAAMFSAGPLPAAAATQSE